MGCGNPKPDMQKPVSCVYFHILSYRNIQNMDGDESTERARRTREKERRRRIWESRRVPRPMSDADGSHSPSDRRRHPKRKIREDAPFQRGHVNTHLNIVLRICKNLLFKKCNFYTVHTPVQNCRLHTFTQTISIRLDSHFFISNRHRSIDSIRK